ncbi:MAG: ATP-binding protein, partial [Thermodesulfovibrionales bacterium]
FNVVINAFQAMPSGGMLTINTEKDDGKLVITITDTGTGVPKENISKVFEPFFSTKTTGLGLGLATTKRIVEEHGGNIEFNSVEGMGSKIIIKIPIPDREVVSMLT